MFKLCQLLFALWIPQMPIAHCESRQNNTSTQSLHLGDFQPKPALAVYLLNSTANELVIDVRSIIPSKLERVMVRVLDPEEKVILREYLTESGSLPWTMSIPMKDEGVYQVRVNCGEGNTAVQLRISNACDYGVSFQNGDFTPWKGQPTKMYFYVPPRGDRLSVTGKGFRIRNPDGSVLYTSSQQDAASDEFATLSLSVGDVYSTDWSAPSSWQMRVADIPFILCNSPEAALSLRASVEVLPDGTVVSHKFQREIADLLPKLLTPEKAGSTEDLLAISVKDKLPALLKSPLRSFWLINTIVGPARSLFDKQNLDLKSHWLGSIGEWQNISQEELEMTRWDPAVNTRTKLKNLLLTAGLSNPSGAPLALAYAINDPGNPYFGNKAILNRAVASSLKDLMNLSEAEVWSGTGADTAPYPGYMAFSWAVSTPAYWLLADSVDPEIKALWTNGLQRVVDRLLPDPVVETTNQSAHALVGLHQFAEGSGLKHYKDWSRAYAKRFLLSQNLAGYFPEASGPDATYSGLAHYWIAFYAMLSQDTSYIDALQRSYDFWNNTVGPEPGVMPDEIPAYGASNLSHRTADGFHYEQYGGGRGVADGLSGIGVWTPSAVGPIYRQTPEAAALSIENWVNTDSLPSSPPFPSVARYLFFTPREGDLKWPAESTSSFVKMFGSELVAVKRPAYFFSTYIGKTAFPKTFSAERLALYRTPFSDNVEEVGGDVTIYGLVKRDLPKTAYSLPDPRAIIPFNGGGASVFWTPLTGNVIMSTNWTPFSHHGIVAVTDNGTRDWEDFYSVETRLDETNNTMVITGKILNQPIEYKRTYTFLDDELNVRVEVKAIDDVTLARLTEVIPIMSGDAKTDRPIIRGVGEEFSPTDLISLKYGEVAEVDFLFSKTTQARFNANAFKKDLIEVQRLEVAFQPSSLKMGDVVSVEYRIRPRIMEKTIGK